MKTYIELTEYLVESSLGRVHQHVKDKDTTLAIISAFRKEDKNEKQLSRKDNLSRNKRLSQDIKRLKHGFFVVDGSYIEIKGGRVFEDSFFIVPDKEYDRKKFKSEMVALCKKYDQDSVLVRVAGEKSTYFDKTGKDVGSFSGISFDVNLKKDKYYTKLRGGKDSVKSKRGFKYE